MRAVLIQSFGDADQLYLGEYPTPTPGPKEILVRVAATALNRADTLQRQGKYPPPKGESPIMGLEMAGVVAATGSEVMKWKVGDKVCALLAAGGYAEYVVVHESIAMPVPENLSLEAAAGVPEVFLTAYQALVWLAKMKAGERLLVHAGASGVGTAAIQLAKLIGAECLVTASASKHETCLELGAIKAIDYKNEDFEEAIKSYTNGEGVDVIIDFIGAPYLQKNVNILAVEGRLVQLAMMGGVRLEQFDMRNILFKRLNIMGSTLRARDLSYKIELTQAFQAFAWEAFKAGKLRPVIDAVYSWEKVAEAHRYMESNRNIGKIILKISS